LAFDEAGGLVVALSVLLAAGGAFAGALVLDVDDGQPQELDDGVVGREVAAGLAACGYLRPQGDAAKAARASNAASAVGEV
jgi:hypothetical protein